jgi:bifunctional non-homologous end joining protein LigD
MSLRRVAFPDFCEPCLPSPAEKPPAGAGWLHEIKHDGFRMLVRRDAAGVRLFTRNGHDWTGRFPLIARAALSLKAASCLIDGEAVACDDNGLPVFDRLRYRRDDRRVFLYAFDLIELNGEDLRHEPIERRKAALAKLIRRAKTGLVLNEHIVEPGDVVFRHTCKLGPEGIISKRLRYPYRSGRSRPEPDRPVNTTSRSRGRSRSISFKVVLAGAADGNHAAAKAGTQVSELPRGKLGFLPARE